MTGIRRKVSANEPTRPLAKLDEAEHNRRQYKNHPIPPGGQEISGTAAAAGTTTFRHTLGRAPKHCIIYGDRSSASRLAAQFIGTDQLTVSNADVNPCVFTMYIW